MNAVERIVEAYFRHCKHCFTATDVKVIRGGQGRQLDLLALQPPDIFFHVECSVTHIEKWNPHAFWLAKCAEFKFCGYPRPREDEPFSSVPLEPPCQDAIYDTYRSYGIDRSKLHRIWCTWSVRDPENLDKALADFHSKHGFTFTVLSFRDEVLPTLESFVGTSNYDDDVLRTLSLIKQRDLQCKR